MILLTILVCLIIVLIGVVWILPDFVSEVEAPVSERLVEESKPSPPTETETKLAREKRQAERALQEVLQRQAVVEAQDVAVWGGEDYEKALLTLAGADAAFGKGDFALAEKTYQDAASRFDALEQSKPKRYRDALDLGEAALIEYDPDSAKRHYMVALALQPESEEARIGSERAENIAELKTKLDRGRAAENNDDQADALAQYQMAVELDSRSTEAQQGLQRVIARLEERRFAGLMTDALSAIQGGRFDAARKSIAEAAKLKPDSKDLRDAGIRLELSVQEARISTHRRKAEKLEVEERWRDAEKEYAAALAIDAQAQFAVLGLSRSRRLATLHDQLDRYINEPGRLQSDAPRANARELIDSLDLMETKGPSLSKKHSQLIRILQLAETPVRVSLLSDGLTEVTINRVGVLGRFEVSTVTLLPGEYIARGHRSGYRDVRLQFSVRPGVDAVPVVIRCEEKI